MLETGIKQFTTHSVRLFVRPHRRNIKTSFRIGGKKNVSKLKHTPENLYPKILGGCHPVGSSPSYTSLTFLPLLLLHKTQLPTGPWGSASLSLSLSPNADEARRHTPFPLRSVWGNDGPSLRDADGGLHRKGINCDCIVMRAKLPAEMADVHLSLPSPLREP